MFSGNGNQIAGVQAKIANLMLALAFILTLRIAARRMPKLPDAPYAPYWICALVRRCDGLPARGNFFENGKRRLRCAALHRRALYFFFKENVVRLPALSAD